MPKSWLKLPSQIWSAPTPVTLNPRLPACLRRIASCIADFQPRVSLQSAGWVTIQSARTGIAIAKADLAPLTGQDVLLADHAAVQIADGGMVSGVQPLPPWYRLRLARR